MGNIGFPVTSYQASVEEWDVPIIEERLRRGGLLKDGEGDAADGGTGSNEAVGATSWDALVKSAQAVPIVEKEEVVEAEPEAPVAEKAPAEVEEPVAEEPEVIVAEEAPAEKKASASAPEPAPTPALTPTPAPKARQPFEKRPKGAKIVAPARGKETKPVKAEPVAPVPTPAPRPNPAAAKAKAPAPVKREEAGGKRVAKAKAPESPPTPKPKRAATRVGRIDLAALGLIKAQQTERKRGSTFTDLRDKQSAQIRDMRQKQRERQRDRRQGKLRPKHVSTIDRKGDILLQLPVTVKSFSADTGIAVNHVIRKLMRMGLMTNINTLLDGETIEVLADDFEIGVELKAELDIERELMEQIMASRKAVDEASTADRAPVIAFMGHVDHGKTSLIDAIRTTRVANKEAGGITQHVGAYVAELKNGQKVTILDTPGHAAFTAMRRRGAQSTDIAVLVVAADDGVMPQTEEAAAHARAAGVPIIVAINKIDSPNANPDQVRAQLAGIGIQSEDWGGEVGMVEVSALKKLGIEELLERVLLEAEILGLKAHAKGDAMGIVLESKLEKGKGKVASVLVQDGTLKVKDVVLSGHTFGKIRLMFDHNGKPLKEAGPSTPVDLLGLDEFPAVGETFYVIGDIKSAKAVAEKRALHKKEIEMSKGAGVTLSNLFEKIDESNAQRLRIVLKADVQGSLEVLKESLAELSTSEVIIDVIHSGVGGVTETDVTLAETAEAIILGFNVVPEGKARKEAERVRVEIRRYDIIYELLEDIEKAVVGMLAPETVENVIGYADVLDVFRSSRWGSIAGCRVISGVIKRASNARLIRGGKIIYQAPMASLRHFKDDVREVAAGNDCGIKIENYDDIKAGDVIESIEVVEIERTLEDVRAAAEAEAKEEANV